MFPSNYYNRKEPVTFQEAIKVARWHKAMKEEINALEQNKRWTLEDLPSGKNLDVGGYTRLSINLIFSLNALKLVR